MLLFCKTYHIKKIQLCITCFFSFFPFFFLVKIGLEYLNKKNMGLCQTKKNCTVQKKVFMEGTVQKIFVQSLKSLYNSSPLIQKHVKLCAPKEPLNIFNRQNILTRRHSTDPH